MNLHITVEALAGTSILDAVPEAIALANRLQVGVKFSFNGTDVTVWPNSDERQTLDWFWADVNREAAGEASRMVASENGAAAERPHRWPPR